jgi:hypothetical protein
MPFDTGVGFAFEGKDEGLTKTQKKAGRGFDDLSNKVDNLAGRLASSVEKVGDFMSSFAKDKLGNISNRLDVISDSGWNVTTSLESQATAAAQSAKKVVVSMGLTGKAAKKATGMAVGMSIGMNVGVEAVTSAMKEMQRFPQEFADAGVKSVRELVKFTEVSGMSAEDLSSVLSDLSRDWGIHGKMLKGVIDQTLSTGQAFAVGSEAIAGMKDIMPALSEGMKSIFQKKGPEYIAETIGSIRNLALVGTQVVGGSFANNLQGAIEIFNNLIGTQASFGKMITGLSTEFPDFITQLGIPLQNMDEAWKLIQKDPLTFVTGLRKMYKSMGEGTLQSKQLEQTLGDSNAMLKYMVVSSADYDGALQKVTKATAEATTGISEYGKAGFSTGLTLQEVLDRMQQRFIIRMRHAAKASGHFSSYLGQLRDSFKKTGDWVAKLGSDTAPGGFGWLANTLSMASMFGVGGVMHMIFPPGETGKAGEIATAAFGSISTMLTQLSPQLIALQALGLKPAMLAAPFTALLSPLGAVNSLLGGIPGMLMGIAAVPIIGITLVGLADSMMEGTKGEMGRFGKALKVDLPILILSAFDKALRPGSPGSEKLRENLAKNPEALWGMAMEQVGGFISKTMEKLPDYFLRGLTVIKDLGGKITNAFEKSGLKQKISEGLKGFFEGFTDPTKAKGAAGKMGAGVRTMTDWLVEALETGIDKAADLLSSVDWSGPIAKIGELFTFLIIRGGELIVTNAPKIVAGIATGIGKALTGGFSNVSQDKGVLAGVAGSIGNLLNLAVGGAVVAALVSSGARKAMISGVGRLVSSVASGVPGMAGPGAAKAGKAGIAAPAAASVFPTDIRAALYPAPTVVRQKAVSKIGSAVGDVKKMFKGVGPAASSFVGGTAREAESMAMGISAPFRAAGKDIRGAAKGMYADVGKALKPITTEFRAVGGAMSAVGGVAKEVGGKVGKAMTGMGRAVGKSFAGARSGINSFASSGIGSMMVFAEIGIGIAGAAEKASAGWAQAGRDIDKYSLDSAEKVGAHFAVAGDAVVGAADAMTFGATKSIRDGMSSWLGIGTVTSEQIHQVFSIAFEKIVGTIKWAVAIATDSWKNFVYGLKGLFGGLKKIVVGTFGFIVTKVKYGIEDVFNGIKLIWAEVSGWLFEKYDKIVDAMDSMLVGFLGYLHDFTSTMSQWITEIKPAMEALGLGGAFLGMEAGLKAMDTTTGKMLDVQSKLAIARGEERKKDQKARDAEMSDLKAGIAETGKQQAAALSSSEKLINEGYKDFGKYGEFAGKGLLGLVAAGAVGMATSATGPLAALGLTALPSDWQASIAGAFGSPEAKRIAEETQGKIGAMESDLMLANKESGKKKISTAEKQKKEAEYQQGGARDLFNQMNKSTAKQTKAQTEALGITSGAFEQMLQATDPASISKIMSEAVGAAKTPQAKKLVMEQLQSGLGAMAGMGLLGGEKEAGEFIKGVQGMVGPTKGGKGGKTPKAVPATLATTAGAASATAAPAAPVAKLTQVKTVEEMTLQLGKMSKSLDGIDKKLSGTIDTKVKNQMKPGIVTTPALGL